MEPVHSLPGIAGTNRVQERAAGGKKGDPEAFRRALQQGADGRTEDGKAEEAPMRTRLQSRPASDRRTTGRPPATST